MGACRGNTVVARFFASLKHDWILKIYQPTQDYMKQDVADDIRYYNNDRLHTASQDMSPDNYKLSQLKLFCTG